MKKLPTGYNVSRFFCAPWLSAGVLALALCSTPALALDKQPRVVGGEDTDITQYPWQVAIVFSGSDAYNSMHCGGSIINESWILTAAHCSDDGAMTVIVGATDLTDTSDAQIISIRQWHAHPDYVDLGAAQGDEVTFDNDIALVELSTPIDFAACGSRCASIEPLTTSNEDNVASPSTLAYISGWGNTASNAEATDVFPSILQQTDLNILDCTQSPSLYTTADVTERMMCAAISDFTHDSCSGDSGGALVVANSEGTGFLQAGIVSWGVGCAVTNYPGVYTRVSKFSRWIWDTTDGACCNEPVVVSPINELIDDDDDGGGNGGALPLTLLLGLPLLSFFARGRVGVRA